MSKNARVAARLRNGILQHLAKRFGKRRELGITGQRGQLRRSGNKSLTRLGVADHVVERDRSRPDVTNSSRDANEIVVAGASVKAEACFDDGEGDVASLERGVGSAERTDEFGAADLAPYQVVRVIDDLHLIGLGVTNAKLDGMRRPTPGMGCHLRGWGENVPRMMLCKDFGRALI